MKKMKLEIKIPPDPKVEDLFYIFNKIVHNLNLSLAEIEHIFNILFCHQEPLAIKLVEIGKIINRYPTEFMFCLMDDSNQIKREIRYKSSYPSRAISWFTKRFESGD